MSTLSIVIPTYNMAAWLPVALESCLWQTCRDFEVIVLDDGSTDASASIADAYAAIDARIRVIRKPNAGAGAARQAGQDAARGDYITWLDADDFLDAEAVQAWLVAAESHMADMVCANAVAFSDKTFNARRYFYHPAATGLTFDSSPAHWKSKVLWRWVFNLSFVRKAGLVHPPYKMGQDVCVMFQALLRARRFVQIEPYVYYFRQEHKSAEMSLDVAVNHALAHFIDVRHILLEPPDGTPRIKPLVKYLNENYWRDVRKLAPRLTGEAGGDGAAWRERMLDLGCTLFAGLDPAWFRAAALAPEVAEERDFLPLVDALVAGDRTRAGDIVTALGTMPRKAADKTNLFHTMRHHLKAMVHPLARSAKSRLRELEARAARRGVSPGAA